MSLEVESNSGLHHMTLDDVVVAKLMGVASDLVQLGVGLVGCQKCVHPQLKDYLRSKVSGTESHTHSCPSTNIIEWSSSALLIMCVICRRRTCL